MVVVRRSDGDAFVVFKYSLRRPVPGIPSSTYTAPAPPAKPGTSASVGRVPRSLMLLAMPKERRAPRALSPIPPFHNPPPEYGSVAVRATRATVYRDAAVIDDLERMVQSEAYADAAAGEFNEWRARGEAEDEAVQAEHYRARREEVEHARERAARAAALVIQQRQAKAAEVRQAVEGDLARVRAEKEEELARRRIKPRPVARPDLSVAKSLEARRIRYQLRQDLAAAAARESADVKRHRAAAARLLAARHEQYRDPVPITQISFLSSMTDTEVSTLAEEAVVAQRRLAEAQVAEHRQERESVAGRTVDRMAKVALFRKERAASHEEARRARAASEAARQAEELAREEEAITQLDARLSAQKESRRLAREAEAKKEEEIAARARFFDAEKRVAREHAAESVLDGKERAARMRQEGGKRRVARPSQEMPLLTRLVGA